MERVRPGEPGRLEIVGSELERGGSVGDERALAVGRDEHADPAGARAGDADDARRDAVASMASTRARPAASRPTAAMSDERAPRRPSQRAAFAAEPPWARKTRPGTSVAVLERVGRSRTTSTTRSPSTTIRAGPVAARRRAAGRRGGARSSAWAPRIGAHAPSAQPRRRPTYNGAPPARPSRSPAHDAAVTPDLDRLAIDTIRTLSIDGVQQANSGHPGRPDGRGADGLRAVDAVPAPRADATRTGPTATGSCCPPGHASMLLYSLLHLTGYDLPLDDLKAFRQWGSRTPGHPESGLTPGVEATTGPLGQGLANAVGMAIAERRLAAEFNRDGHEIVDHWTYVIASDGDLQEGIASEASSLAGHLRLGKLVVLYDDNHIQLDGPTSMAWSEDVPKRFEAYGWHTQRVEDGNDLAAIEAAIEAARADDRPSLIAVRTHIGFGSPNKQDSQKAHGSPLGPDEVRLTKEAYGWDPDKTFYVPDDALRVFRGAVDGGQGAGRGMGRPAGRVRGGASASRRDASGGASPGELADGWDADLKTYEAGEEIATRNASQDAIQALAGPVPELFGGAADLSESNLTDVKGEPNFSADEPGRNLRFGVREHGMGGIANGIAYHGGFIPYDATFLTFSDYMRGAVRLSARWPGCTSSTSGRTTPWAWARTGRPTSRSSTTRRCGRSRTCGSSGRAMPTRRRRRGRWPWSGGTGRSRWHSPGRSSPCWRARPRRRARACAAAGTCCATRRATATRS